MPITSDTVIPRIHPIRHLRVLKAARSSAVTDLLRSSALFLVMLRRARDCKSQTFNSSPTFHRLSVVALRMQHQRSWNARNSDELSSQVIAEQLFWVPAPFKRNQSRSNDEPNSCCLGLQTE
jgi:hypothetical protein